MPQGMNFRIASSIKLSNGGAMILSRVLKLSMFVAVTVVLAACGKTSVCQKPDVVCIGSVAPLTGPQSHLGKDSDAGVRFAADEINAKGLTLGGKKVRIEVISEDDQADPKTGTVVAQKLVDA
ncbi:MAG TPA: ABC transporter substrate-binding protein, partial [Burkholderiaceae bacterium]|nr:ABC transporter substrate-binding protein [Burkholderiaceae bacterium]